MARVQVHRVAADEIKGGDVLCIGDVLFIVESARTINDFQMDIHRTDLTLTVALPPDREVSIARAHGKWSDDEIVQDLALTEGANGVTR